MTKVAAKSTAAGHIVYFLGAPLRKVAQRSVCFFKKVVPFRLGRVIARKSSPPRKLTCKKKPNSVCGEDCNNQCFDSDSEVSSTGSSPSCCSSVGSNHPPLLFEKLIARWSSMYRVSHSVSHENCYECYDSDSSEFSTTGLCSCSCSCLSCCSSLGCNHPCPLFEKPTVVRF